MTAVLLVRERAYLAHIGSTAAYLARAGSTVSLTVRSAGFRRSPNRRFRRPLRRTSDNRY